MLTTGYINNKTQSGAYKAGKPLNCHKMQLPQSFFLAIDSTSNVTYPTQLTDKNEQMQFISRIRTHKYIKLFAVVDVSVMPNKKHLKMNFHSQLSTIFICI